MFDVAKKKLHNSVCSCCRQLLNFYYVKDEAVMTDLTAVTRATSLSPFPTASSAVHDKNNTYALSPSSQVVDSRLVITFQLLVVCVCVCLCLWGTKLLRYQEATN